MTGMTREQITALFRLCHCGKQAEDSCCIYIHREGNKQFSLKQQNCSVLLHGFLFIVGMCTGDLSGLTRQIAGTLLLIPAKGTCTGGISP